MRRIWDMTVRFCLRGLLIAIFAAGTMGAAISLGGLWVYVVSGHGLWVWDHGRQDPAPIDIPPAVSTDSAYLLRPGCT